MCDVRQILFLPLGIFVSYVSLIQNKVLFGTLRRISDLTNLSVASWAFSCLFIPRSMVAEFIKLGDLGTVLMN